MNWQEVLAQLEAGTVRAANQDAEGNWHANVEAKQAILAAFKAGENVEFNNNYQGFVDKHNLPARQFSVADGVRLVPGGSSVRAGAYVAPGVIIMPPAYINVGAYVDSGTMVDSHALIGSCAQIGKNVHVSAAVQIGGVLEPVGASPVIIEDNAFIGSAVSVMEGVHVGENAILGSGVMLTASTRIIDVTGDEPITLKGHVPANSVVIPGSYEKEFPAGKFNVQCALIIGKRGESQDKKVSLNDALRNFNVSV